MTEAVANTALMEVLLMIITALLSAIAWGLRKGYQSITETLNEVRATQEQQDKHISRHRTSIFGKDGTPWDGFETEIKKSRRGIIQSHRALNQQARVLKRHRRALKRSDIMTEDPETDGIGPNLDDLESLGHVEGD